METVEYDYNFEKCLINLINTDREAIFNKVINMFCYRVFQDRNIANYESLLIDKIDKCIYLDSYTNNQNKLHKGNASHVDCNDNIELFYSIIYLNNENDLNQYFTNGKLWKKCETNKWETYTDKLPLYNTYHKAMIYELIYYFNKRYIQSTKITWYPENSDTIYNTFNSIEEAINNAKQDFINKTGDYYGCDNRYSPRIRLGEVIHVDYDVLTDTVLNSINDTIFDELDMFSWETNSEIICNIKNKDKVKQTLFNIIKNDFELYPTMKSNTYNGVYDLLLDKWITEE